MTGLLQWSAYDIGQLIIWVKDYHNYHTQWQCNNLPEVKFIVSLCLQVICN